MQQPTAFTTVPPKGADASTVAEQAKDIARMGTKQVKDIAQTAKERALHELDNRRKGIAAEVDKLASVLEKQGGEGGAATPILDAAASAARGLSNTIRTRSSEELFRGLARSPMAVLAGSFALGFLALRLLKA